MMMSHARAAAAAAAAFRDAAGHHCRRSFRRHHHHLIARTRQSTIIIINNHNPSLSHQQYRHRRLFSSMGYSSSMGSSSRSSSSRRSSSSSSSRSPTVSAVVDTLIVGGGPMGSSTAYHLALLQQQQQSNNNSNNNSNSNNKSVIWVLERDPTYQSASATVSAAGIRQQFSWKENVQMSAYGRDFLRQAHDLLQVKNKHKNKKGSCNNNANTTSIPDVQFVEHGYLFLAADERGVQELKENHHIQTNALAAAAEEEECQTHIDLLTQDQLQAEFPWLNTEDLLLGSFGRRGEGWFDPWALLMAWKEKNVQDLGVVYRHATPVNTKRNPDTGSIEYVQVLDLKTKQTEWIQIKKDGGYVVNAAGAHAADLLDVLAGKKEDGHSLQSPFPVRPRKRSMFFFHCADSSLNHQMGEKEEEEDSSNIVVVPQIAPLTIDPLTGVYFRSEGPKGSGHFVCGVSPPADQDVDYYHHHYDDCFDPDARQEEKERRGPLPPLVLTADHHLWEDIIWPALYHRVPAFGNIKLKSSWAGLYEYNTLDQNAIIDVHPEIPNVMLVNGFSGHGLQHSMAAGRAVAERLEYGQFVTLDLTCFGYDRILGKSKNGAVVERGIV